MSVNNKSLVEKFGVELEMILAFHEDRLIPVLIDRGLTRHHIVKDLSKGDRYDIGIKRIPVYAHQKSRPSHRGWALKQDPNDLNDWRYTRSGHSTDFRAGVTSGYRTYWAEPLEIVREILKQKGLRVDVELSTHPQDPTYNNWKMLDYFSDRVSSNEKDNWDTTGIEVVTPPMPPDVPSSFKEIEKYLAALRGDRTSNYGISTSKYAGLHVHIGFATSQDPQGPLRILQHLAYILVQFEPLIVKFFPPYRDGERDRNTICANETLSNRASALKWRPEEHEEKYASNPTLQDLATTIFQSKSIPALKNIMHKRTQHKGYQVNFLHMASASVLSWNTKRTIEFRIHESTIDSYEIEMWVKFCLALCRTAERQATKSTDSNGNKINESYSGKTEFIKYKNRKLDDRLTTTALFDLLEFDDELRKYWQARWDRYHNDQHMERPTPELDPFAPENSDDDDDNGDDDDDDSSDNDEPKGKGKSPKTPGPKRQSPATPKSKGSGQASQGRSPATPKSGSKGKQRARAIGSPAGQGKTSPSKGSATSTSTTRKRKSPSPSPESKTKPKSKSESPDPDSDLEPKSKKQKRSSGETCTPAGTDSTTNTTSSEPKRPRRAAS